MSKQPGKKRQDFAQNAFRVVQEATGQAPKTLPTDQRVDPNKNSKAVAAGRIGGKKGGPARAIALTKEQLSEIARNAAKSRWKNHR